MNSGHLSSEKTSSCKWPIAIISIFSVPFINPLSSKSDQHQISPSTTNAL